MTAPLYATKWWWLGEQSAVGPGKHYLVVGETSDGRQITLAEIEQDCDDNLDPRMSDEDAARIARIMAAGEDMLAALRDMLPEHNADPVNAGRPTFERCEAARAAIAKAEGSE